MYIYMLLTIHRINIGGKSLTNYLKELISYRHWNMMDETHIINIIKVILNVWYEKKMYCLE